MKNPVESQLKGKIVSFGILEVETKDAGTVGESRIIRGYANKAEIDRGRDLVLPSAYASSKEQFMKNPVMFYNHDWDIPIGKILNLEIRDDGLFVVGEIAKGLDMAEMVWSMIQQKLVTSFSIGFIPKDIEYEPHANVFIIKDLELLEISVVTIPMNADALFQADGKNLVNSLTIQTPEGTSISYKALVDLQMAIKEGATVEEASKVKDIQVDLSVLKVLTQSLEELKQIKENTKEDDSPEDPIGDPIMDDTAKSQEPQIVACQLCKAQEFKYAVASYSSFGETGLICLDCILVGSEGLKQAQLNIDTLKDTITALSEIIAKQSSKEFS